MRPLTIAKRCLCACGIYLRYSARTDFDLENASSAFAYHPMHSCTLKCILCIDNGLSDAGEHNKKTPSKIHSRPENAILSWPRKYKMKFTTDIFRAFVSLFHLVFRFVASQFFFALFRDNTCRQSSHVRRNDAHGMERSVETTTTKMKCDGNVCVSSKFISK